MLKYIAFHTGKRLQNTFIDIKLRVNRVLH